MEIKKVKVNLNFKVKRAQDITRLIVMEYGKEEFDIVAWAQRNTTFGPNYLIRDHRIFEILPPSIRPDFKGTPEDAITIVVISGNSSDNALEYLKEHLRPKVSKPMEKANKGKVTKVNEADKPHSVRSTGKGK